jgi:DNA-binding phage protein
MVTLKKKYKFYKTREYQEKHSPDLIAYDPVKEMTDENFIGKAILECLRNNDPKGVMEVIEMYLGALEKTHFVEKSQVPKSTLYHSLKSKNPTIKTLAKLVHATTIETRK